MLSGDCNVCINGKLPSYSATCVECGLSRKNYKPITKAEEVYDKHTDTAGNLHWNGTATGENVIPSSSI